MRNRRKFAYAKNPISGNLPIRSTIEAPTLATEAGAGVIQRPGSPDAIRTTTAAVRFEQALRLLLVAATGRAVAVALQAVALHLFVEGAPRQLQQVHHLGDIALAMLQGTVQTLRLEGLHLLGQ